jgi:pyruvate/2-oxoglutarate dehydrogenase complex dihydrolipoamide acyltransferase (E2) component
VVDSIDVTLGSVIAVGDKVATIEAMKMKNDVRSHVAGKVTNIAVIVNQGVETGQVLDRSVTAQPWTRSSLPAGKRRAALGRTSKYPRLPVLQPAVRFTPGGFNE